MSANATGSGLSDFEAMCQDFAITDSSPRRDEMTRPRTETMSPKSVSAFHWPSASSPTSARESMTCS